MPTLLLWFCLLALALPAQAEESRQVYQRVLPEQSHIEFVTTQLGVAVPGRFRTFRVQLHFDPARPSEAWTRIELDMASVEAGSELGDAEVQGVDWFDVAHHPRALFESTSLRPLGKGRYEVRGLLTLRGHSREVKARFRFQPQNGLALLEGQFNLRRLDYGIGESVWGDTGVVSDQVKVRFHLRVGSH